MKVCDISTQLDTCVTCLQTGNDGHVLAASFADGHVKMWDTRSRQCVLTSREHKQMVLGLQWSGVNSLVSGCADGVVKVMHTFNLIYSSFIHSRQVWDMRRGSSVTTHRTNQPCLSLDIHPSSHILAAAHTNGQLAVYSVR